MGAISDAESLVLRASAARNPSTSRSSFRRHEMEWIYETAAIKMVVSAERFLEYSLGMYVIGVRKGTKYRPRRVRILSVSLPAILSIFAGDRNFVGWVDGSAVVKRAKEWLRDGEPFNRALVPNRLLLNYVQIMRNSICHDSDSAFESFQEETRLRYGALPSRVTPGFLLMSAPPLSFSLLGSPTLFAGIADTYKWIAKQIVP